MDRDSKEYGELASNIKLQVCNKAEKAVCCQPEPEEVVSIPVDSNYLVYEIERSDGSFIFVPIIYSQYL